MELECRQPNSSIPDAFEIYQTIVSKDYATTATVTTTASPTTTAATTTTTAPWSEWSDCTKTCGSGTRIRTSGQETQEAACNTEPCGKFISTHNIDEYPYSKSNTVILSM